MSRPARTKPAVQTCGAMCASVGRRRYTHLGLLATLILFAAAPSVHPASAGTPSHATVIVLLDASGSMRQTDPDRVRVEAVRLLLAVLQDGDRISLAEFGNGVRALGNETMVLDTKTRATLSARAATCTDSDGNTDILSALRYADGLIKSMDPGTKRAFPPRVVLLTDGHDDVGLTPRSRWDQLEQAAVAIGEGGGRIYALALSSAADLELLRMLCDQTEGELARAETQRELPLGFFRLSRAIANRWLLFDRTVEAGQLELPIPSWSRGLTLAYFPSRTRDSGITLTGSTSILASPYFELLRPDPGNSTLGLTIPSPGGRLVVDSQADFVCRIDAPDRVASGLPFAIGLRIAWSGGTDLGAPQFLSQSTASAMLKPSTSVDPVTLYDDGMHNDGDPADGFFGGTALVSAVGEVTYDGCIRTAFSPSLCATGVLTATDEPVAVHGPSTLSLAIASMTSRAVTTRLQNLTSTSLELHLECNGQHSSAANLPPDGDAAIKWPLSPAPLRWTQHNLHLGATGLDQPLWEGSIAVPPFLTIPMVGLALALLVLSGFVLPRRRPERLELSIKVTDLGDSLSHSAICRIGKDGHASFRSPVPEPFSNPGRFHPRNGFWRRGVVYQPEPQIHPTFTGTRPIRRGAGWVLRSGSTWTVEASGSKARYTLTVR